MFCSYLRFLLLNFVLSGLRSCLTLLAAGVTRMQGRVQSRISFCLLPVFCAVAALPAPYWNMAARRTVSGGEGVALGERDFRFGDHLQAWSFISPQQAATVCDPISNLACSLSPDRHCMGVCIFRHCHSKEGICPTKNPLSCGRDTDSSHSFGMTSEIAFCVAKTCVYLSSE